MRVQCNSLSHIHSQSGLAASVNKWAETNPLRASPKDPIWQPIHFNVVAQPAHTPKVFGFHFVRVLNCISIPHSGENETFSSPATK